MAQKKTVKKAAPKTKAAKTAKPKKAVKAASKSKPKVAKKVKVAKPKTAATKTKTAPKSKAKAPSKAKAAKENKSKVYSTGEKCPASGLYEHFCKDKGENSRIPLSKTETFPPCRSCGSVKWVLVMAA